MVKTTSSAKGSPMKTQKVLSSMKCEDGLYYPEPNNSFFISEQTLGLLDVFEELSKKAPVNVLLLGPTGCGKTTTALQFAAKHKRPICVMDCGKIREPKDWFGSKEAENGSTVWKPSAFVRALKSGNAVILLDEFTRLHTSLHNSIYALLDDRRSTYLDELGEVIEMKPGIVCFATANIGSAYAGTFTLDAAIKDRFSYKIQCDFLPPAEEKKVLMNKTGIDEETAKKLAQFARLVRKKAHVDNEFSESISTRQLEKIAEMMLIFKSKGWDPNLAFSFTILPSFSSDGGASSERGLLTQLIQGIFKEFKPAISVRIDKSDLSKVDHDLSFLED